MLLSSSQRLAQVTNRYPKMQENPETATGSAVATSTATASGDTHLRRQCHCHRQRRSNGQCHVYAVAPRTDRLELVKELLGEA